jgi:hypothetical protein
MRYSELSESGYAIKRVTLPIANIPHGVQGGTDEQRAQWEADGKPTAPTLGMRILSPGEDIEVDHLAELSAKKQGVEKYDDVHPICVKERMVYTLATACVDPDTGSRAPLLFFGDTVEQAAATLRNDPKHVLTFDTVVYLHEIYEIWRDKINPQAGSIADYNLAEIHKKAAEDADFLAYLRPGMRLSYTHILAVQHLALLELTSTDTAFSRPAPTEKAKEPAKEPAKSRHAARSPGLAKAKQKVKRR